MHMSESLLAHTNTCNYVCVQKWALIWGRICCSKSYRQYTLNSLVKNKPGNDKIGCRHIKGTHPFMSSRRPFPIQTRDRYQGT